MYIFGHLESSILYCLFENNKLSTSSQIVSCCVGHSRTQGFAVKNCNVINNSNPIPGFGIIYFSGKFSLETCCIFENSHNGYTIYVDNLDS